MKHLKEISADKWICLACICLAVASILCLCACRENRLERALSLAGENRAELEKVLDHYSDDSLKLEAARFLIENMPGMYSMEGEVLAGVRGMLAGADTCGGYIPDSPKKSRLSSALGSLRRTDDITHVSAELLIHNIDLAFSAWRENPWGRDYTFSQFCEWMLPYRIGDEPLEDWRRKYHDRYRPVLDSLYQGDDMVEAADRLSRYLSATARFELCNDFPGMPHHGASFLLEHRIGSCREITDHTAYVFRALGFPVGIDRYIYSPAMRQGHIWNSLLDRDGTVIPFWYTDPGEKGVVRGNDDGRKKGKVYRLSYPVQSGDWTLLTGDRWKDVSSDYFGHHSYRFGVEEDGGERVLLAVFSFEGYVPVSVPSKVSEREYEVSDIERGLVYHPVVAAGVGLKPAGYPFIIEENGRVRTFVPYRDRRERATLRRKYPLPDHIVKYMSWMTGGRIYGSRMGDFSDMRQICEIADTPRTQMNMLAAHDRGPFMGVRFLPPDGWRTEVAQLEVYGDGAKIPVASVRGARPNNGDPASAADRAVDGDWVSFYYSHESNGALDILFDRECFVDSVLFIPRSDDNFIRPGDRYELFYQDGTSGWRSLGERTAVTDSLQYENIPVGSILRLHNLSRGREEQVFYLDNGRQVFAKDRGR